MSDLRPGTVPPHNLDAEGAVLAACLLTQEAVDEVITLLSAEDFYADANRRIYAAIAELAAEGTTPDLVAVAELLRANNRLAQVGGTPYIAQLSDATPSVANLAEHCRIVRDLARVRRAQQLCQRFAGEAYGDIGVVRDWLGTLEHEVYLATADRTEENNTVGLYADVAVETFHEVQRWSSGPASRGLLTGFTKLDNHVGGWCGGDLWYVAGRPGMGKTSWVAQAAESAASYGQAVIFFSLEMKRKQLMLRSISRRATIPMKQLRSGRLEPRKWDDFARVVTEVENLPIVIDDASGLTPARLRSKLRRHLALLRGKHGNIRLAAVIIDYVQLMHSDAVGLTRNGELEEISHGLKDLAKVFDCTVVGLSQLSRPKKGEKVKRPELHDLRDCGALEQDADVVLFIHREDEYREPQDRDGNADLIVAKGRNCGTDIHFCKFDGRYTSFYEEDPEMPYQDVA